MASLNGDGEQAIVSPTSNNNNTIGLKALTKPYRCNVCKYQCAQASGFDIHLRSVAHQTRVAKLADLIARGEVDASQPIVEQPENMLKSDIAAATQPTCQQCHAIFATPELLLAHQCDAASAAKSKGAHMNAFRHALATYGHEVAQQHTESEQRGPFTPESTLEAIVKSLFAPFCTVLIVRPLYASLN